MKSFEIGKKMKVRPKLKLGSKYNGEVWTEEHDKFKGKLLTIKSKEGKYVRVEETDLLFTSDTFAEEVQDENNIKLGDIIEVDHDLPELSLTKDEMGIVIEIKNDKYGVEFYENKGGHSCGGNGKDGWCWYLEKNQVKKINKKEQVEVQTSDNIQQLQLDELTQAIRNLSSQVKKEDPFKKAMIEGIIEKGKELATEDLKNEIKEELDRFIQTTYGALPKKIEMVYQDSHKEMEGIFHKDFENICKIVQRNIPLMLVGGAGAGKNYTLEQVAKALDLDFYFTNAVTQEFKLTGYKDANGVYHETQFYKAFTNGGMFFLDEIDASCPEALITLNSAIANRYFDFPIGRVEAHKDFRVVCAGNTYGTGADMVYVGRNVLDGATLDRFVVLEFDYDENVERQLSYDNALFTFLRDLREAINEAGLRYIVSMRAFINATKLLEIGMDKEFILKTSIVKNMQKDDLNIIIEKLNDKSSDWYKSIKRLCD